MGGSTKDFWFLEGGFVDGMKLQMVWVSLQLHLVGGFSETKIGARGQI